MRRPIINVDTKKLDLIRKNRISACRSYEKKKQRMGNNKTYPKSKEIKYGLWDTSCINDKGENGFDRNNELENPDFRNKKIKDCRYNVMHQFKNIIKTIYGDGFDEKCRLERRDFIKSLVSPSLDHSDIF